MRLLLAVVAALAAVTAAPARAQGYDPRFRWRTLQTAHFQVHFHQGEDALAQEVARQAERAHAALVPLLGHAPDRRTQVVLSDDVDDANGSATPLPYPTIRLYAVPPAGLSELNDFHDWVASLVFHEYVHILHLDEVGGLPALGNLVFGRVFFPNGLVPTWMVEGLAVLHEGDGDGETGRNRSALYGMYARALALEGRGLPPLHELSNPYLDWPRGQLPYLLGGRFMEWLRDRYGEAAVRAYLADQGGQVWPYAPSWAGRRAFGEGFPELWNAFRADETARFRAQVEAIRARPVTRPATLTRLGGRVESPRWLPDGSGLALFHAGLDERSGIWRVSADGRDLGRAAAVDANGAFTIRSAREAIVAETEIHREYRVYDDLYRVDLARGTRRQLTHGERATDPDLGADGRTLVYVVRPGPGRLALVRRDLETGRREVLLDRPGALVYAPRLSPDGRRIAFELQEGGRRDVAIWEDGRIERVTDDDAIDLTPAWSPDGRWLFFASDRTGVYDLYALDTAARTVKQVTNMETGALAPAPSPDGRTLAFVTYSRQGYDLATIPLDPATWLDPNPLPDSVPSERAEGEAAAPDPVRPERSAGEAAAESKGSDALAAEPAPAPPYPSHAYRPSQTIWPTWWFPFFSSDPHGTTIGAMTSGADVVGRHAWALQGWWGLDSHQAGYSASYLGGWSWPRLDLASYRFVDWSSGYPERLESIWTPLEGGVTFTSTRLARALALRLGWSGTLYDTIGEVEPIPDGIRDQWRFEDGFLSEASIIGTYSDVRRYARSISPEEGRSASLSFRLAGRELGSDFSLWRARGSVAQYARVPWTRHAALALRLAGGIADGSIGGRAPFRLGGLGFADPAVLTLPTSTAPSDTLRGYEAGAVRGNAFVLANAEVRFPIASPRLGRTTWPVFLRRLHGAVFLDAGDAFEAIDEPAFDIHPFRWDALRFGTGAELRAETAVGYALLLDVRLGYAHGLGRLLRGEGPGDDPRAASQVYLTIGSGF